MRDQLEDSVSEETLMATECDRDEAREAARMIHKLHQTACCPLTHEQRLERWPWLEQE
jgi:hypothetical protein